MVALLTLLPLEQWDRHHGREKGRKGLIGTVSQILESFGKR